MCASRIHTIDRGWMREKERKGKKKKEGEKGRGNDEKGGKETASAKKYKEPD